MMKLVTPELRSDYKPDMQLTVLYGLAKVCLPQDNIHTVIKLGYYKQRILHEWSCHMKFMKQAGAEFHKFHMK